MADYAGGGKAYPGKAVWSQDGSIQAVGAAAQTGTGKNVPDHADNAAFENTFPA